MPAPDPRSSTSSPARRSASRVGSRTRGWRSHRARRSRAPPRCSRRRTSRCRHSTNCPRNIPRHIRHLQRALGVARSDSFLQLALSASPTTHRRSSIPSLGIPIDGCQWSTMIAAWPHRSVAVRERGVCCSVDFALKDERAVALATVLKALADPTRVQIVAALRDAKVPLCTCDSLPRASSRSPRSRTTWVGSATPAWWRPRARASGRITGCDHTFRRTSRRSSKRWRDLPTIHRT